ncbi:MAG: CHAT domain-containing protein [Bacteroidia bacterium]
MNILRSIVSGVILLLSFFQAQAQDTDTLKASKMMRKAQVFADSSEWDSAISYFGDAAKAWANIAEVSRERRLWERYFQAKNSEINSLYKLKKHSEGESLNRQILPEMMAQLGKRHLEVGVALWQKGQFLRIRNETDSAIQQFLLALDIQEAHLPQDHVLIGITLYDIAYLLSDQREAIKYYQRALPILKNNHHILEGKTLFGLGYSYNELGDYQNALDYYLEALPFFKDDDLSHMRTLMNLSSIYSDLGKREKALESANQSLQMAQTLLPINDLSVGFILSNMASIYYKDENFGQALDYHSRALAIFEAVNHPYVPSLLSFIGLEYFGLKDYEKSNQFFEKAFEMLQSPIQKGGTLVNLGSLYTKNNPDKALDYYFKALPFLEGSNHSYLTTCLMNIGIVYEGMGEFEKALKFHHQSLAIKKQILAPTSKEMIVAYINLGSVHLSMKKFDMAREYYQKSILFNLPEFTHQNVYRHPDRTQVPLYDASYINSLRGKGNTFWKEANENNDLGLLFHADTCFQLAMYTIEKMRKSFRDEDSKYSLLESYYDIYERAIQINLKIYELTRDTTYLYRVFNLTEKSKAVALSDVFKANRAWEHAALPSALTEKVERLKNELVYLESVIFQMKNGGDSSVLVDAELQMTFKRRAYDSLLNEIESSYSAYYQLKYGAEVASMEEIQRQLSEEEVFITYFWGGEILFGLAISKDDYQFFSREIPEDLSQKMREFHRILTSSEELPAFTRISADLYNSLLKPLEGHLLNRKIIISPSGLLGLIPFEVLLKELPESNSLSFSSLPFLVQENPIAYTYSGTFLIEDKMTSTKSDKVLAFAPAFNSAENSASTELATNALSNQRKDTLRGKLANLKGIYREVALLGELFSVLKLEKEMATESAFKSLAQDYGILHLATHAIINAAEPANSYLIFTTTNDTTSDKEDNNLYAWELYNMRLNAQMAVLSACNTGFGKLQRGEGVMSLGRAFAYAGVPSIVMSLWPAEDESTADLMGYFYEGLAEGQSKDEALRNAKLRFLKEMPPSKHHPFYWAGFVVQGDAGPLKSNEIPLWIWGLCVALIGCFYAILRKK